MPRSGSVCLLLALAAFTIFFSDVALGAMRLPGFLGDIGGVLTLLAATVLFVAGVLQREATEKNKTSREE